MPFRKNLIPGKIGTRKISETLLDFASPLTDALGRNPSPDLVRDALKIAWTVWNAVNFEDAAGEPSHLALLRASFDERKVDGRPIESLILRKRNLPKFANDHRMMGELQLIKRNGEWTLRLEARMPPST